MSEIEFDDTDLIQAYTAQEPEPGEDVSARKQANTRNVR